MFIIHDQSEHADLSSITASNYHPADYLLQFLSNYLSII